MGLISRVSSRTYRKSQKPHKYQKWLPRLNRPVGQSLKNTSSFETVSSKLNLTNSSNENWPRMDTLELLSENLKLAKSSSSPPDQVKFWEKKTRRIRELTAIVNKRWGHEQGQIDLYVERVANRGLSAVAQAESLRYKLLGGLAVRRAAYGVLRFVMEQGARGCEVVISGKIRGQRAKGMKFTDGMMIHSGFPTKGLGYVDTAVRHVLLRQGVLGVKVKILKPHDESGLNGPKIQYPDIVTILEPKEETSPAEQKVKDAAQ